MPYKNKEQQREYYLKNKERLLQQQRERLAKIKETEPERWQQLLDKRNSKSSEERSQYWREKRSRMFEHLGGKCVRCGTTENLEINHKNLADTEVRRKGNSQGRPGLTDILEDKVDVELMCKKCHTEWSCAQRKAAMRVFANLSQEEQQKLTEAEL